MREPGELPSVGSHSRRRLKQRSSSIYINNVFFILSFVGGHLGCFYTLTSINNAAVNTEGREGCARIFLN